MKDRTTKEIIIALEEWFGSDNVPEMLISDNAKEFESSDFKRWCANNEIIHRKISIEAHESNGRIERAIRTIREGVYKLQGQVDDIDRAVEQVIEKYNKTYHSAIKCTPQEAVDEEDSREELR